MDTEPVTFTCRTQLQITPAELFEHFKDVDSWTSFEGYGILPGIQKATYQQRTEQMEGSVIQAVNTDGSRHKEQIRKWQPGELLEIKMHDFTAPLSLIATHFKERWTFEKQNQVQMMIRTFYLFPKNPITKPLLRIIALLLKKAVTRHSEKISSPVEATR